MEANWDLLQNNDGNVIRINLPPHERRPAQGNGEDGWANAEQARIGIRKRGERILKSAKREESRRLKPPKMM